MYNTLQTAPANTFSPCIQTQFPIKYQIPRPSRNLNFRGFVRRKSPLFRTYAIFWNTKAKPKAEIEDDFMTRIFKENPCQVEPKFLIDGKFYTSAEREILTRKSSDFGVLEILKNFKGKKNENENETRVENDEKSDEVYLKDLLREHKGKLYVPEQVFADNLSEEEQFDRDMEILPRMGFEDFEVALKNDKVKSLTFKESDNALIDDHRDFVVELKEIAGDKSLHKTKWSMRLPEDQAGIVLLEYKGPRNEIEKRTMSWVGKLPDHTPHPVASSISSRMMAEFGAATAVIAAAAAVVTGFLASAVLAGTALIYTGVVYVLKPIIVQTLKIFYNIGIGILEKVWDMIIDFITDSWVTQKCYEVYMHGSFSASMRTLLPIGAVLSLMLLAYRINAGKRKKNYFQWDLFQCLEFALSKARARVDGSTGVTFKDVAGIEPVVEELQELVLYLKNPELFEKTGIKPPHGVLLEGPPGCGKTLVAKAIAGEAGVPFYEMAGSEFVEILVGVGSARVRDLFKRAKVNKPSVIFIDEIDALATKREGMNGGGKLFYNSTTQEKETTLNQLLTELDGFDTGKGVIFLAATNRRDLLDPALLRPGRFDRKIKVRPPNAKGRLDILKVHAEKVKLSNNVDLSTYANNLNGWSGAKLAQLLQEAALVAVRRKHKSIIQSDLDDAVDRLTLGPKRVGLLLGQHGQCRRATVEVGTALTSNLLRRTENANIEHCDRVSIIPHGKTLSQVVFKKMDNDDAYLFEREPQLLHRLQVFLGGRAAEEVIFGRDTSAASTKYLADASWLARKIISVWNLENPMTVHGEHPPWKKRAKFEGPRLDFEGTLYACYMRTQPPLSFCMDDDIAIRTEKLLEYHYQNTVSLLRRHQAALLKSVKVCLNRNEIWGDEIEYILDHYPENMPASVILEESDPGNIPLLSKREEHEQENRALENRKR